MLNGSVLLATQRAYHYIRLKTQGRPVKEVDMEVHGPRRLHVSRTPRLQKQMDANKHAASVTVEATEWSNIATIKRWDWLLREEKKLELQLRLLKLAIAEEKTREVK